MAIVRSHEMPSDVSPEREPPVTAAYTDVPGGALPKDGTGNWGVAARFFILALLAIAFLVALYVLFGPR
jgi:hypothetical protein